MICEFCSGVHDVDIEEHVAVDLYVYENELVACCFNCLSNLDIKKRQPIHLPDGWEVIKEDKRWEIEKGEKAFIAAHKTLTEYNRIRHINMGYHYDLSSYIKRVIAYFEELEKASFVFKENLGLSSRVSEELVSGAYCPGCKSPLLHVAELRADKSLSIAASRIASMMSESREERNGTVFVCLGCQVAYVEDRPKKKGKKS